MEHKINEWRRSKTNWNLKKEPVINSVFPSITDPQGPVKNLSLGCDSWDSGICQFDGNSHLVLLTQKSHLRERENELVLNGNKAKETCETFWQHYLKVVNSCIVYPQNYGNLSWKLPCLVIKLSCIYRPWRSYISVISDDNNKTIFQINPLCSLFQILSTI